MIGRFFDYFQRIEINISILILVINNYKSAYVVSWNFWNINRDRTVYKGKLN